MVRSLLGSVLGIVLGATIGALLAGVGGGVLGSFLGLVLSRLWVAAKGGATGVRRVEDAVLEKQRLLCMIRGQEAECVLVRDRRSGRWVDVESCSLSDRPQEPQCEKRCLILMNDVDRRPRERTEAGHEATVEVVAST